MSNYNNVYYYGDTTLNTITRNTLLNIININNSSSFKFMPIDVEDYTDYSSGTATYKLRLTGFNEQGVKTCLIVNDIQVYFDILITNECSNVGKLYDILEKGEITPLKIENIKAYPLFGFNESKKDYLRLHFVDLQTRKNAITLVRKYNCVTASDDMSCYYRKVSRDYNLKYADWILINRSNCKIIQDRYIYGYVNIDNISNYTGELTDSLKKDKCLIMTWDIETYTNTNTGEVPKPCNNTDNIFMICGSLHWGLDFVNSKPLYKFCIVDVDIPKATPNEITGEDNCDIQTIVCGSEINIIKAFGLLLKNLMPDILIGFNDHEYDWDWIIERSKSYGLLSWFYNQMTMVTKKNADDNYVYDRMVRKQPVKISPSETMFPKFLKCVGNLPIDIRIHFKKMYKKEEITKGSSLNFYLKINKLTQKVDLPHLKMFAIYERAVKKEDPNNEMDLVRYYCVIDSVSCFRLFAKQLVMSTLRENANLSYISLYDEYSYAGSMKIRNKIIKEAQGYGILCPNITREKIFTDKDKFSGAHVFDPIKGLESSRPVIPLDFKSLYPSIIIAFNLSPEKFTNDPEYAKELIEKGYDLYHIDFDFKEKHYDAWFIRHSCTNNTYGLIPTILRSLFASRISIQKQQKAMDLGSLDKSQITDELQFEYDRLEIKQKAIKVFMNSIYGVSGMDINPLFLLEQAVAITKTGRSLINTVANFVRELGFTVKYGDSVAKWTPIMILDNNINFNIHTVESIAELYGNSNWLPISNSDKEYCDLNIKIWSDLGWTNANRIIRHKLPIGKKMMRIITRIGLVDVTDDHSLLYEDLTEISPKDVNIGDRLLHHQLPNMVKDSIYNMVTADALEAQKTVIFANSHGLESYIEVNNNNYIITCSRPDIKYDNLESIKSIEIIDYSNDFYVYDFTTDNSHFAAGIGKMIVHNTDSVYLTAPDHYYTDLDELYNTNKLNKLDYWTKLVERSQNVAGEIRDTTNTYLEEIVKNNHIKMEDEEIKFPVMFTGKKKYAGIKHDKIPNFYPDKWFIRGIDIIKEGQPQISIDIGNRIMKRIFDVNKPDSVEVLQIVEEEFLDAIKNQEQWSIDHFIQSDAFRPLKKNVKVQTFVARMKDRHKLEKEINNKRITDNLEPIEYLYEPPSPGERFKYILTKQLEFFDLKGKKITLNKGERMEYPNVVVKNNLEIDIAEFLKSKIISIGARFINFYPQFQMHYNEIKKINNESDSEDEEEDLSELDKHAQKMAKKYLEKLINQFVIPPVNHNLLKRAYKDTEKQIKSKLGGNYDLIQRFELLGKTNNIHELRNIIRDITIDMINKERIDYIEQRNRLLLTNLNINYNSGVDITSTGKVTCNNIFKYYKLLNNIIKQDQISIDRYIMSMNLLEIHEYIKKYNITFEELVYKRRRVLIENEDECKTEDILESVNDFELLNKFYKKFNGELICLVENYVANRKLQERLNILKTKRIGNIII